MSGVDYQAVPTSPDLEAAGARNLALLAADASDLNANEAKPRHDAAGRQPNSMTIIMTLLTSLLQACCTMTLICAFVCLLVTIIFAKGGGRILMACLPGVTCGMRLACLAQDGKGCIAGVPTFLIFLMLPMLEMPWWIMALEMVAAVASAVGLQLIGLLLAWLGFLCLLVPVTWQIALCVLPGILSAPCLWCFLGSPRDILATTLLLWVLALPLSSFPRMLALLELPAYIAMCWLFQRWWHALFKVGDDAWMVIVFAVVAAFLPVGTFAFIRTSGSEACQWCWYGQWSRAFTPLVLMLVYNATEVCALAAAERHQLLSRGYFLSRLLVAAVLLVAPMLLVEVVDLRPSEYVNVTWHNAFNVSFAVNKTHLHWLQMPHPVWPTQSELARAPATRNAFWLCYMLSKFVVAGFFSILMLKCRWSSSGNRNQQKGDYAEVEEQTLRMAKTEEGKLGGATENVRDESRSMMLFFVLGSHLVMCSKVCISAGLAGQLTAATGLAFEGYDLCLSAGLLWLLAQAVAVRFVDVSAEYSTADVCMTMLFLVPFVGDGFDSLKDAMLASVAMNSDNLVLKCLGWGGLVYLFLFHMALLCIPRNRLEL